MSQPATRRTQQSPWLSLGQRLSSESRQVAIGHTSFQLICLGDMEEALSASLKAVGAQDRPASHANTAEFNPYFGVIWPAAVALSEHLDHQLQVQPKPKMLMELGCGLALPSLLAARRGVGQIIATDRHPLVGEFLVRNCQANDLGAIQYAELDWRHMGQASTDAWKGGVDLLVGSDLLYEAWQPGFLAAAAAQLLAPGGTALFADPGRHYMDDFLNLSEAHGLSSRQLHVRSVVLGGRATDVLIAELGWK